jgi:hypothetical protein
MLSASRKVAFVLLAALALIATGCGSNNKGKIEGKWKATSVPGMDEKEKAALKMIGEDNVAVIMEFTADGKMKLSASLNMLGKSQTKEMVTADYKLGSGDWVFFSNMNPPPKDGKTKSKDKIVINGDTMTIDTEKGEKITLTRVK